MGHLAFIGSHKINGVSALHTELVKRTLFHDLDALYPGRIVNKTNGITFRRWLFEANPGLTRLLVDTIGERVLDNPGGARGFREVRGRQLRQANASPRSGSATSRRSRA